MVLRWFATGYLETEKHFRRLMGYEQLWMLKAKLQEIREVREEQVRTPAIPSLNKSATDLLTPAAV
jgi:hypothetical protein